LRIFKATSISIVVLASALVKVVRVTSGADVLLAMAWVLVATAEMLLENCTDGLVAACAGKASAKKRAANIPFCRSNLGDLAIPVTLLNPESIKGNLYMRPKENPSDTESELDSI
jgi:hypothetical protein